MVMSADANKRFAKPIMKYANLSEFIEFEGILKANENILSVNFQARINLNGETEVQFDKLLLTKETVFIQYHYSSDDHKAINYFSLTGKAADDTKFMTQNLFFSSMGTEFDNKTGSYITFGTASCSKVTFNRNLVEDDRRPLINMRLRRFKTYRQLDTECSLGTVVMGGTQTENIDMISGYIQVAANEEPTDLKEWQDAVEKLMRHIRYVMSFASGVILKTPVIESYANGQLEVTTWSQAQENSSSLPIFHWLYQELIFDTAVKSYFQPPFHAKNLHIAIEWFSMGSSYTEIRLVSSMTVLENLISSNLEECDTLIQSDKNFQKHRSALRKVIKACIDKWPEDNDQNETLKEMNEKLADLNRRSLLQKLKILADRWQVPLDDINPKKLQAAINARNLIVHTGQYSKQHESKLWLHFTVIHEVVVRFLLTALGYQGRYTSHLEGLHDAFFPSFVPYIMWIVLIQLFYS